MPVLEFTGEGKEFQVSCKMLRNLAENFPEDERYAQLAANLLDLGIPSISEPLLARAVLPPETGDAAWDKASLQTRALLLKNRSFVEALSIGQAQDIMDDNYIPALVSLASRANLLFTGRLHSRLDKGKRSKLMNFLCACPHPGVRYNLATNSNLPSAWRPPLLEQLAYHVPHSVLDFNCLTAEELPELGHADPGALAHLAWNVKKLRSATLQKEAVAYLAGCPDPLIRLNLAEGAAYNGRMTEDFLKAVEALCHDPDPDVALAARKSLDKYRKEYEK